MTLKFDGWPGRTLLLALTLLAVAGLLRVITSHFVIRAIADRRYDYGRDALLAAAAKQPASARVNYRLAESDLLSANDAAAALAHATAAANLSPWDHRSLRLLATAQELNGLTDEAENSTREAARLAPNHAVLNWTMANILLRRGKFDEALGYFKTAVAADDGMLPLAMDLVWQGSQGKLVKMRELVGDDPERQLSLVRFLIEQKQTLDAIALFNSIDRAAKLRSPRSAEFMSAMIGAGQYEAARGLWLGLVGANSSPLVWSGDFEAEPVKNFGQFDWVFNPNQYARIEVVRSAAHAGERSLRIVFNGLDTTALRDQIHQMIVLRPNTRYRVEFFAKAEGLVIPEGPRVVIGGAPGGNVIAASAPLPVGTYDWQIFSFEFISPADVAPKFLSVIRIPKFSYDDPANGTIWLDDISLVEK